VIRSIDFIYKSPGVNRPLRPNEDNPQDNLNKTYYRDQINKVANAIDEIIRSLKRVHGTSDKSNSTYDNPYANYQKEGKRKDLVEKLLFKSRSKQLTIILLSLFLCAVGAGIIYRIINYGMHTQLPSKLEKSIAVLPFTNDSPDKDNEYVCNGMMEDILNQLQKIKDIRVKSRTSVEKYRSSDKDIREIGHELGVSLIMEGSVRKIGDDLRIAAQLIDVKTGDRLWSDIYDGKYTTEIFEFQSNVAKKVAASLNAVITPREVTRIDKKPTANMLAFDLCAKASGIMDDGWFSTWDSLYLKLALDLYNRALEVDPKYSDAIGGKGNVFRFSCKYDSAMVCYRKLQEIDPEDVGALIGIGSVYVFLNKPDSALIYIQKALDLSPNDPGANEQMGEILCLSKNDVIKGLPYFQKAYDLGGSSEAYINQFIAFAFFQIGEYQKALKYINNAFSLSPKCEYIWNYVSMLTAQGKYDETLHYLDSICPINACEPGCDIIRRNIYVTLREFEKAEKFYNKDLTGAMRDGDIYLALLYKETGRKSKAVSVLNNSIKRNEDLLKGNGLSYTFAIPTLCLAATYAMLDDKNKALYYLSELEKTGLFEMPCTIKSFSGFDNLGDDPEFKTIVKRIEDQRSTTREKVREMELSGELHL
jgi:TolB-like protein